MRRAVALFAALLCALPLYAADLVAKRGIGRYTVPRGLVAKSRSTSAKPLYVLSEDAKKDGFVDSVSIEGGKSRYALKDHAMFRNDILAQILAHYRNGEQISASGGYTERGYVVYTFIITEDSGTVTKRFYIIPRDNAYVLVQETTRGTSEKMDEATRTLLRSYESPL